MSYDATLFVMFVIFSGGAVAAALSLYARQSLLVAYIALGCLAGPWGFAVVTDSDTIQQIGHVGIIFLLFLLGLNLHPQKLLRMFREALLVTTASAFVFAAGGAAVALAFGFNVSESLLIGAVMMFSSTIISLKLLPTTALHHRHMGEVVISVLLLQDIVAIVLLLTIGWASQGSVDWREVALLAASLPALAGFAFLFERYVLVRLMVRFDKITEYVFLTAVGWCLGVAQLGHAMGLSYEVGAFTAGVALATSRIAYHIADSLRPLRDFFLIMFFFSIGASFDLSMLTSVWLPAAAIAVLMLLLKPWLFKVLLVRAGEEQEFSWEVGARLGQLSEFALLIAVLAVQGGVIGDRASSLIQSATIITFVVSSYVVMLCYPTPIAVSDRLRRD